MSSIKSAVEQFLYPFIEHFTEIIDTTGEETVIEGIRVLDEDSAFTHGALIHAASILYIYYEKNGDPRKAVALSRLNKFIDIFNKKEKVFTWGKLGALRALHKLNREGLLSNIGEERLQRLNVLTEYEDFLDKDTIELKGYATNYYQVALACAAYREALGFESGETANKIEKKFFDISFSEPEKFMDDELGFGRYDRYSVILSSEVSDLYRDLGRPLSQNAVDNLRICAEQALFMANKVGDGFNYGRSLSVHGDLHPAETLASALSRGLLNGAETELALSYIFVILQKAIYFWYDGKRHSFNIWCDGRTTNDYRGIHRLLEVNMDMACHIFALYDNIVAAGLENEPIKAKMPSPEKWEYLKIDYSDRHCAYILRYKDTLSILPFIGTKVWGLVAAYNPFPPINGFIEASPESTLPFLIPEYSDKFGNRYRPAHFVNRTEAKYTESGLVIYAYGNLMKVDDEKSESDIEYRQEIQFSGNEILCVFEAKEEFEKAEMFTAEQNEGTKILVAGFEDSRKMEILDNNDFKTPHGAYAIAYLHTSSTPARLAYKAKLMI